MSVRRFRDPVSGWSHVTAAVLALGGTVALLLVTRSGPLRRIPMLIYGACMVGLFAASGAYHLVTGPAALIARLRKLDHSAIYLLIAGSYTPTAALVLNGPLRLATLIVVWALAAAGIVGKLFTVGSRRWLYTLLYLLMGWMGVGLLGQLGGRLPAGALAWLLGGGVAYTAGAVLYVLKWPRLWPPHFSFHEVWHLFVIAGAACHFVMHIRYLAPLP